MKSFLRTLKIIVCGEEATALLDIDMARFAVSDSEDQRAAVWIVSILLLSYTTLTSLVRGFVKLKMMGLDDGVASVAQLLTYGNVASVVYALHYGLARRVTQPTDNDMVLGYGKVSQTDLLAPVSEG